MSFVSMVPTPDAKIKGCHSTAMVDSSKLSWAATIWLSKLMSWEPPRFMARNQEIIYITVILDGRICQA